MSKFELYYPLKPWTVTQPFGANATSVYAAGGFKGHTGIDVVAPFDTAIFPAVLAPIYRTINFGAPIRNYRCRYQIVDCDDYSYEVSYGHCNTKLEGDGTTEKPIATVGNSGDVYTNGAYVIPEERGAPNYKGTHLHFQVRQLAREATFSMALPDQNGKIRQYVMNDDGSPYMRNGKYYRVYDYWNGYNGCIDPAPFFNKYYAVDRPKVLGVLESAIKWLTSLLTKK
jgi:murein DD-endopeptidase MepM/ murein hydrolase activator NlpD